MQLFPAFLKLNDRRVLVVGGGRVAASKLRGLLDAGARVTVVAPAIVDAIASIPDITVIRRRFEPSDLDGAWLVVAAATPEVNREVARAAGDRRLFVNAVDDPPNASLYLGGVVRRAGATMAISTDGRAPAIAGLLREGLDAVLPETDLERWLAESDRLRAQWRRDGTPMQARRPELLEALIALYGRDGQDGRPEAGMDAGGPGSAPPARTPAHPVGGFVSLIGAGPGDPDLLTVRGAQRLAEADLVLYDGLVPESTVALATRAQHFSVAKRAGRPAVTQETIHRLMIRGARRGKRVVRLKNGDPFLLGRGGEEALALASAGVPFEVIPGVTAAVAAPGLAGIPVTHRGMTTGFTVVSGHAPEAYEPILRGVAPESMTLVVLMGLRNRERIARTLLDVGWRPDTPAAVVLGAATPGMATWRGRLDALADERFEPAGEAGGASPERGSETPAPGTIVVGEVARLRLLIGADAERRGDGELDAEGAAGRRRAGGQVR
ncbi:MAG: uroporphyrinogen-III C-methyltransferase [Acidobacteria bacterium]|nr:uroporphyrinogen-III C-methyltransferase [Acidobacteriota bacterium]